MLCSKDKDATAKAKGTIPKDKGMTPRDKNLTAKRTSAKGKSKSKKQKAVTVEKVDDDADEGYKAVINKGVINQTIHKIVKALTDLGRG